MNISLPDDLEKSSEKTVYEKKGNISEALEEAIDEWIKVDNKKGCFRNQIN